MKNKENELEMFSFDKIKDEFIGDPETIKQLMEAVANQGKKK